MQIRVLGPFEVVSSDGAPSTVRGTQRRLLFASLVLRRNVLCSTEHLIDVLFGDQPPTSAAGTVQSYVSRLRRDLGCDGARLRTRDGGYTLTVLDGELDSDVFELQVADASTVSETDPDRAADQLVEALAQWHGDRAYGEFHDAQALRAESTRLDEIRQQATEALVEARIACSDHAGAIDVLERCTDTWPLREGFRYQQMLVLHRSGRQPEALHAFRRFGDDLAEYGLTPSPTLVELEARILRHDPLLGATEAWRGRAGVPVPASESRRPGNLPHDVTRLVGRDVELSDLARLLHSTRLLTVTGPGGVGKTRLAMRVAEHVAPNHPDGTWVCDLSRIREGALAIEAVATVLDVQRRQGRSVLQGLVEVLQHRDLLVVFDNCEHVLDPLAEIVAAILRTCPSVRVIATSREPLGIDGETVRAITPLPLPLDGESDPVMAMESPAVRLFVARAASADPEFRLSTATVRSVADICRRVDGLPLALELAAARVRSMGPADLADRLQQGFGILGGSPRRDARHPTLDATIRWSYDLLGHAEQLLFDRLSVFATSFTVEDAEETCADGAVARDAIANVIGALVDKSMIAADTTHRPTRYTLLETLRSFGHDQLDNDMAVVLRRRHLTRAIREVEQASAGLDGPDESLWVERIEERFDDLRVAHRWAMANGDVGAALELVVGLGEYAFRRMRYELFSWVDATLDMPEVDRHPLAPAALASAAYGRFVRGDLDQAMALVERSTSIEARDGLAPCGLQWRAMGNVFYYRGQSDAAADSCAHMVDAARRSGSASRLVHALYMAAVGLASSAQTDDSGRLADEAMALAERMGNPTALASALYARALAVEDAQPDHAATLLTRAVSHGSTGSNRWIVAFARTELVSLAGRRGDLDRALADARDVIDTWYRAGDWANQWLTLRHVAGIFVQRGELHHAAVLHAAVRTAMAATAMPIAAADSRRVAAILARLPEQLGPAGVETADAEAASMSANDIVHHTQHQIDRVLGR